MSLLSENTRPLQASDMTRMALGRRYWDVRLESIPDSCEYKEKLVLYVTDLKKNIEDGIGLMLAGDYRSGKTSAAAIVGKAVMAHYGTAYFIRADEISSAVIEKWMLDDDETVENRMITADLLIIDDLGAEHTKDFGKTTIERILRVRFDSRKSTIVTTNRARKDLEVRLGVSLLSVMMESMALIKVSGTSWVSGNVEEVNKRFEKQGGKEPLSES